MRTTRSLLWALVVVVLTLTGSRGSGQDASSDSPIIPVSFDHMVPITYPLIHTRFDLVRPTTYPLIDPGIAHIPMTENLTNSFARPLVPMYEAAAVPVSVAAVKTTDHVTQQGGRPAVKVDTGLRVPTPVPPKLVLPIRASKPAVKTPQRQR